VAAGESLSAGVQGLNERNEATILLRKRTKINEQIGKLEKNKEK